MLTRPVDEYIESLTIPQQSELRRIQNIVSTIVPTAEQGISYKMPAFLYRGKPLLSCIVNKKFLSIYPFSGKVISKLSNDLAGFELTAGSIHFSLTHALSEDLITQILNARIMEIDEKL